MKLLRARPCWSITLLVLCLMYGVESVASATTFYVAPDGNDSADGRSAANPWRTLARAASGLVAGDEMLLQRNGVWHESLTLKADGEPRRPILIGAYGVGARPCIDGGDIIKPSTFGASGAAGSFLAPVNQKVQTVWENGDPPMAAAVSMQDVAQHPGSFWCDGKWLYLHPIANADPHLARDRFEIPGRDFCVEISKSYIALRSLAICHAARVDRGAVTVWADHNLAGIELSDCDISCNCGRGVWFDGPATNSIHDVLIAGNTFRDNDGSGALLILADGGQIRGNTFTGNCRREIEPWQAAIRLWSGGIVNLVIRDNTISDQRGGHGHDSAMGIHCDETGEHVSIVGNVIRNVDHAGIEVENTKGVVVEKNLVMDCNIGILLNRAGHDETISRNRILDSRSQGISMQGWFAHGVDAQPEITVDGRLFTRNLIQYNSATGSRWGNLKAVGGAERVDGALGNVFRGNDFGPERPGFIEWGEKKLDRYDQWPVVGGASGH
jgi:hypothetical protein